MNTIKQSLNKGFTLIEMAIVLVILALLIGAGFTTLSAHLDNANQAHTMNNMQITKRALLDYVLVNRHMPCPDTDGDGLENRGTAPACDASTGTVPFVDIGLGRDIVRDEWNNIFGYGINTNATSAAAIALSSDSASYFNNQSAPVFDLQTPPTAANSVVNQSYWVCRKDSATCATATASTIEVDAIPAVITAFNQNGGATTLGVPATSTSGCNAETGREAENCDGDLLLWKGNFDDGAFDDQIVTISGYEIKQQVLDLLNNITLNINAGNWDGYDVIIRGDVDNSNDLNIANSADNSFYIDQGDNPGEEGSLNANVVFASGDDRIYITNDVEAGGNAQMKAGNDEVIVGGDIADGGAVTGGSGDDTLYIAGNVAGGGTADLGDDADTFTIEGSILYRGSVDLGTGDDTATIEGSVGGTLTGDRGIDDVTVVGDVTGTVDLGNDDDVLYISGDLVGGELDGGSGADVLKIKASQTDWDAVIAAEGGTVTGFETILYNQ